MKIILTLRVSAILFAARLCTACSDSFLEVKSSVSIESPTTIEDFQALLDDAAGTMNSLPPIALAFIGGEEFDVSASAWHGVPVTSNRLQQKNAYIWKTDVYEGESGNDWNSGYKKILYANLALEGVEEIAKDSDPESWNNVKGSALFFRAWNHYLLAQQFCNTYSPSTAEVDLGLPLRMQSDVTLKSERSTLQKTYLQIVDDLKIAVNLLPRVAAAKTRPSRSAGQLLLAKVYMDMEEYQLAFDQLESMGDLMADVVDYKQLNSAASYPFVSDFGSSNPEVLFLCYMNTPALMTTARMDVKDNLLQLYDPMDLRGKLFYKKHAQGNRYFVGSYMGSSQLFIGLCMPEAILIKAECYARLGRVGQAADVLYELRLKRYEEAGDVVKLALRSEEEAIHAILGERRRELAFRGNRWSDLRRFNKEPAFALELSREIDDDVYRLVPEGKGYVWQIPNEVILLSGIKQN